MKNLFFTLVFVLVGHLGIANTSNAALDSFEDFGTCTITIEVFSEDGELLESITFTTDSSELSCRIQAAQIAVLGF